MTRRLTLSFTLVVVVLLSGLVIGQLEPASAQFFGTTPWNSQFYGSTDFTNPIAAANPVYPALNFNWPGQPTDANGIPVAGVPADNFSVIFTSTQNLVAGTYIFSMIADDRARLLLNGTEVINITAPNPANPVQVPVIWSGGPVAMRVEFVEFTLGALLQLQWSLHGAAPGPGDPFQPTLVPTPTPLPTQTPLPPIPPGALSGTVIRAAVLNVRNAPSLGGQVIDRVLRGQTYAVIGRDQNARWFLLQLSNRQGWVWGHYLAVNGNEFNAPVVSGNTVLGLAGFGDTGVRVQTTATLRLREAPTVASQQIGRIDWGAFLPVVGRTADGNWYQVIWKDTPGWVSVPFVRQLEGNLANVPVR
jgi:uncharacterized protein YraI